MATAEDLRLEETRRGIQRRRWGPYLSERQWGTVREDYSADGSAWEDFPHDQDALAPTTGARTASREFLMTSKSFASPSRSGMASTQFLKKDYLDSQTARGITART